MVVQELLTLVVEAVVLLEPTTAYSGGNGGSGVAILRYVISGRKSALATGGSVSFYNGKTIHAFTGTRNLHNTSII